MYLPNEDICILAEIAVETVFEYFIYVTTVIQLLDPKAGILNVNISEIRVLTLKQPE